MLNSTQTCYTHLMGHLITVEGGEFTGKSSVVVPALFDMCQELGIPTIKSREPGGLPQTEKIRQKIFDRLRNGAGPKELAVLFNMARKIHLTHIVRPFFRKNPHGIIILDRYCDSTFVYQGCEAGVPMSSLLDMHKKYADNCFPDFTLLLHFPPAAFVQTLLHRSKSPADMARDTTAWDESDVKTHKTRQKHYLSLPTLFKSLNIPRAFAKIDASLERELVQEHARKALLRFIKKARRAAYQHSSFSSGHNVLIPLQ